MAIDCKRCGGPTMAETVIKLRRGILGFRETRFQGGYCPACRLSVPVESHATRRAPSAAPRLGLRGFVPAWLRVRPARNGHVEWV